MLMEVEFVYRAKVRFKNVEKLQTRQMRGQAAVVVPDLAPADAPLAVGGRGGRGDEIAVRKAGGRYLELMARGDAAALAGRVASVHVGEKDGRIPELKRPRSHKAADRESKVWRQIVDERDAAIDRFEKSDRDVVVAAITRNALDCVYVDGGLWRECAEPAFVVHNVGSSVHDSYGRVQSFVDCFDCVPVPVWREDLAGALKGKSVSWSHEEADVVEFVDAGLLPTSAAAMARAHVTHVLRWPGEASDTTAAWGRAVDAVIDGDLRAGLDALKVMEPVNLRQRYARTGFYAGLWAELLAMPEPGDDDEAVLAAGFAP
jgi:hypothetical protein